MLSTLMEIHGDGRVCMQPAAFVGIRNRLLANIDLRRSETILKETEMQAFVRFTGGKLVSAPGNVTTFMGNAQRIKYWEDLSDEDEIINVVRLTGAMTRGGGDCSYGSLELRDMLMRGADIKQTRGHIIYGRTPGGMASTLRDFRMAINYCHSKGQKVYFYCDGDVASGGAFTSAMCDGTWASNPEDEIGSLGMYSAFFSLADGAKNEITSEVYHEYYAEASPDKNKWYREASVGNMDEIERDTNHDLAQLLANLKKDRPQIKAEHMTGAMYPMSEVVGSLVDSFGTIQELGQLILDDYIKRAGAPLPPKEVADPVPYSTSSSGGDAGCKPKKKTENDGDKDDDPDDDDDTPNTNQVNNLEMNKKYVSVAQFIGEQPMESDKDGILSLQPSQADALEAKTATVNQQLETIAAENTTLKQEKETLTAQVSTLQADKDALTEEVATLKEQLATAQGEAQQAKEASTALNTALAEVKAENVTLKEAKELAETTVATQKQELEANAQTILDQNTTIEELNLAAGNAPDAGESPHTNGASAMAPTFEQAPKYNPALTVGENKKISEAYEKKLAARAYGV